MTTEDRSPSRTAVWAAVACILAASVATGPLVGAVDLTRSPDPSHLTCQGGTASVDVETMPSEFTLERGEFGADSYTFSGEPARVRVGRVSGCPRLVVRLRVPALRLDARQIHFLDADDRGELTLSSPGASLPPASVNRSSYEGTVTIELQGEETRVLSRTNVTILVEK